MKYQISLIRTNKKGEQDKTVVSDVYADSFVTETNYDPIPYTRINFYNVEKRWLRDSVFTEVAEFLVTGDYIIEHVIS